MKKCLALVVCKKTTVRDLHEYTQCLSTQDVLSLKPQVWFESWAYHVVKVRAYDILDAALITAL